MIFVSLFVKIVIGQTPLTCDADISGSISTPGEVDQYTFTGVAGERVIIRMNGDFSGLDARLELVSPSGAVIATDFHPTGGLARIGNPSFILPQSGTYLIRASDNGNNETETYGLSLQILKPSCTQTIGCNSDFNGNIDKSAKIDAYSFDGIAGENIIARMNGDLSSLDAALELYDPDGLLIASHLNASGGLARLLDSQGNNVITLTKTGTYILLAMDDDGNNNETYGLSLQILKPSCAQLIDCFGSVSGSIQLSAEMDAYYFDAQSCSTMQIIMAAGSSFNESLTLYGSDGTFIQTAVSGTASSAQLTVQLSNYPFSSFLLVVEENEGDNTGNYTINLSCLSPTLTVNATQITQNALGGMQTLEVTTACSSWQLTGGAPWVTTNSNSGSGNNNIALTFDPNPSPVARTTTFTLMGCCHSITINVTQSGATLTAVPTPLSVSNDGDVLPLTINSTCSDWVLTVPADAQSWIDPDTITGSASQVVSLTFLPNNSPLPRNTTLLLAGCGITFHVAVNQAASTLTVSPMSLNVGTPAGQSSITVTSNCNNWVATTDVAWLSVIPGNGSNNGTVSVVYEENCDHLSRSGTVTLTGCGITRTINVTQAGATLAASPTTLSVASAGGSTSFNVTGSCCGWTVSENADWFSLSISGGTQPATITVFYETNTLTTARSDTIFVNGCGLTQIIVITQAGVAPVFLNVSPQTLNVAWNTGQATLAISSNCSAWSVSADATWIILFPTSGSMNGTVTVFFENNPNCESRTATITLTGCGLETIIPVTQTGQVQLSATPNVLNLGSASGQSTFSLSSNCTNWTATANASWLTVIPATGSGNATVTLQYQANTSTQPRTATIAITCCGETITVTVTQAGQSSAPYINVSPQVQTVPHEFGQTTFEIISNCDNWTITDDADWLFVSPESGIGNATITAFYSTNASQILRTAHITITGCGINSVVTIHQDGMTAVWERPEVAALLVFPNPASEAFSVEIPANIPPGILRVRGFMGNTLSEMKVFPGRVVAVHSGHLPEGIYLVEMVVDGEIRGAARVVKMR